MRDVSDSRTPGSGSGHVGMRQRGRDDEDARVLDHSQRTLAPPCGDLRRLSGHGWYMVERSRGLFLVQDMPIRIVDAATGELPREVDLDPSGDCQPARSPNGPTRKR